MKHAARTGLRSGGIVLALAALLASAGCNWLESSGGGARTSPFLSGLKIAPAGVFCGPITDPRAKFTATFNYSDPQNDLFQAVISLVQVAGSGRIETTVAWGELDLSVAGRAVYSTSFPCGNPAGRWTVNVTAEDAKGHISNTVSAEVLLNSTS